MPRGIEETRERLMLVKTGQRSQLTYSVVKVKEKHHYRYGPF